MASDECQMIKSHQMNKLMSWNIWSPCRKTWKAQIPVGKVVIATLLDDKESMFEKLSYFWVSTEGTSSIQTPKFRILWEINLVLVPEYDACTGFLGLCYWARKKSAVIATRGILLNICDLSSDVICAIQRTIRNLGVMNVLSNSDPFVEIGRRACRDKSFAKAVCGNILLVLGGLGSSQINAVSINTAVRVKHGTHIISVFEYNPIQELINPRRIWNDVAKMRLTFGTCLVP